MTMIAQTMENARKTHSLSEQAWVLQHGMESLLSRVSRMTDAMPMSTQTDR